MTSDNDRLNLLLELRRFADAEKLAREAIGRNPDWAAGYTHLARALIGLNRKEPAIKAAREGVKKAPQDAWAVGTLACTLNWFGNSRDALQPALDAVRLDPTYAWAFAMLSNIQYNQNAFKDAHATALRGLAANPLDESLLRWKGWAEHKLDRFAEGLVTAQDALTHYPNSHMLQNLIGCLKWTMAERSGHPQRFPLHREADAALRDALRLDSAQPVYHENLRGNALSCRGYLLKWLFLIVLIGGVVIPVATLAIILLRPPHYQNMQAPIATSLIAVFAFSLFSYTPSACLCLPLSRWKIPNVPQSRHEHWAGRVELAAFAFVLLIPYLVLAYCWIHPAP